MKIGILSDTHGHVPSTGNAVGVFRKAGVSAVFHCGDIGSLDVLTELAGLGVPVHAVFGNVDIHSKDWKFFPAHADVQLHGRFGDIELEGKRIALLHSDDRRRFNQTVSSGEYDLVLTGHSHEIHDHTVGRTRYINPGTAGRGMPDTCAVLDLASGELTIHRI
ncbi:MAG: YfcE family phosphodiesterase [Verrucomicrobiota bacterium]|nr:YfcE family phosphodiesterase [Verrucomicrobiota bacterium]